MHSSLEKPVCQLGEREFKSLLYIWEHWKIFFVSLSRVHLHCNQDNVLNTLKDWFFLKYAISP